MALGFREFGEPAFAAAGPAFVGWLELVDVIQRAEVDFDFVVCLGKDGAAAGGAEVAALVVVGLAGDGYGGFGEDGGGVKQGAVVFAAIKAVADTDAQGRAGCGDLDLAAVAAASYRVHSGIL